MPSFRSSPPESPLAASLRRSYWRADDARLVLTAAAEAPSFVAFAEAHGLDVRRLYRWRDRLASPDSTLGPPGSDTRSEGPVRFLSVIVDGHAAPPPPPALDVFVGTARIVVPVGFDGPLLRSVVAVLGGGSC
jgi:hypothetical protein